jgi:shikimate kinase
MSTSCRDRRQRLVTTFLLDETGILPDRRAKHRQLSYHESLLALADLARLLANGQHPVAPWSRPDPRSAFIADLRLVSRDLSVMAISDILMPAATAARKLPRADEIRDGSVDLHNARKCMKRVLITGMSGTRKSSVIRELVVRGYPAYDLDTPEWSEWIAADPADVLTPTQGKDWVWRGDRVRALLSQPEDATLFIGGCAENMGQLFPLIDAVILLSAPATTIMERLRTRCRGSYGSVAEERRRVNDLISKIEPLLRKSADYEIDTRRPVHATVDEILRIASRSPEGYFGAR